MVEVLSYLENDEADFRGDTVLIQYTVINNVNDSEEQAQRLVSLPQGMLRAKPRPSNAAPSAFNPSSRASAFKSIIHNAGIRVMVRFQGQDIEAACGQLVTEEKMSLTKLI